MALTDWTEEQQEELIAGFWAGVYTMYKLPSWLYAFTAQNFAAGYVDGYNQKTLAQYLEQLNYMAANKTAVQMSYFQSVLLVDGSRVTQAEFVEAALSIDDNFNVNYLKTEYNTINSQAGNIANWNESEKPLMKYVTMNDPNVRHEHAELNGVIKPKDSEFWDTYAPSNGWNCRCFLRPVDAGAVTPDNDINNDEINKGVPSEFRYNPAKDPNAFGKIDNYKDEVTPRQKKPVDDLVNGQTD